MNGAIGIEGYVTHSSWCAIHGWMNRETKKMEETGRRRLKLTKTSQKRRDPA